MIKLFGELWWDYNEKPFNFQGIICLESTICWGFYAIGIVQFLHMAVYRVIDYIDYSYGVRVIYVILFIVTVDYIIQLLHAFHIDVKEKRTQFVNRCQSFIARWY